MTIQNLTAEEVLNDDSTSNWLKQALKVSLEDRDILDALNDVSVLQTVLTNVWKKQIEHESDEYIFNSHYYQHHGE